MAFKPLAQLDFSGGANLVVNPYLVSQKQAADVQNMLLDEHGSLRSRDGIRLLTTSPDTTNPLYFRGILTTVAGQEFPFAIQAGDAGSAVGFDTTAGANFTTKTPTLAFTCGASATALLVAIALDDGGTINSVTYDGVSLTRLVANTVGDRLEFWGLLNPTTGSSKNIVVSYSAANTGSRVQGMSFTNVTGFANTASADGNSTTPSVDVASATNHMVVAVYSHDNGSGTTATPNNTEIFNATYSDNNRAAGQRAAGAASVTSSWTLSAARAWQAVGVDLITGGNKLYDTSVEPWTDEGDLNSEVLPDAVYMADKAVILHGYSTPKTWNGTTLAAITADVGQTVPPGAKHGEFHLGALWLWNTNATTTSLDGPSSLRASATNDPDDWPNANQIFISKDDGQVGMGMSPFTIVETGISPTATLVLFKNYSGYQVTGVFGSSTFGIQPIKSDMGCIAPRTIQFVSGFGIIRLTHKGFALYNGVEDRLISEEMRPAIFGGHGFDSLDFSTVDRSWATQSQNPPLYVAACPVSGTALTRLFVYDLIRRGWSICTLPITLSTMNLFFSRTQFPVIHVGEATGGGIYEIFNGEEADVTPTGPVSWSVTTRAFFAGNQMTPVYWRRAHLSFSIEPGSTVDVTPIMDGRTRTTQTFDSSASDEDLTAHTVDTTIAVDLMETAHTCQLLIEGANHCHLRGIEFHIMPKPSTKYLKR